MRICPDCHKIVSAMDSVMIGGQYYHKSCRVCHKCGEVIKLGKHEFGGHVYHASCYLESLKCCVCGKQVLSPYTDWYGNVACNEHAHYCTFCGRIITPAIGGEYPIEYGYLEDGIRNIRNAYICGDCKSTVISSDNDIERCRQDVMNIFNNNGISGIPVDIPISLSDMLKEEESLGLTPWGLNYSYITSSRGSYSCKITMKKDLPELQFKGTLGHELLHSWLYLYAIELPQNETEGFCNLGSMLIYKYYKSDISDFWVNYIMEQNDDPIYGEGYRLMKMRLDKLGWKGLMDALLLESNKP